MKIKDGFNKYHKGNMTGVHDWIWRTRNKEESNIALNMGDKMHRDKTKRKASLGRRGKAKC